MHNVGLLRELAVSKTDFGVQINLRPFKIASITKLKIQSIRLPPSTWFSAPFLSIFGQPAKLPAWLAVAAVNRLSCLDKKVKAWLDNFGNGSWQMWHWTALDKWRIGDSLRWKISALSVTFVSFFLEGLGGEAKRRNRPCIWFEYLDFDRQIFWNLRLRRILQSCFE